MRLAKILLFTIAIGIIFYFVGYNRGFHNTSQTKIPLQKAVSPEPCPVVDKDIDNEYLNPLGVAEVIYPPIPINSPTPENFTNEEFNENSGEYFGELLNKQHPSNKYWVKIGSSGVDGDDNAETYYGSNSAMTGGYHHVIIVKNKLIIFNSNGWGQYIESAGDNGFVVTSGTNYQTKEALKTRYMFINNQFIPKWTQKTCLVSGI